METVTISVDRYNTLLEAEKDETWLKEREVHRVNDLKSKIENLYTLEHHERYGGEMYVRIDKLNLLGLLGLNFKKEDGINKVFFEFVDRGLFIDSNSRF
ncbi:hypothetical protein NSS71_08055 [Niallia sp. FSL W8-0951]|uniref:hypothetical protein n=1 Tax=Niallia sp. FSL W8-0951 TaxID=2954639 RepID=UPI0030F78A23